MYEPKLEPDASQLCFRLGSRLQEVLSGFAAINAARERRPANCDDIMAELRSLNDCDLCDLLTECLPPTTPEE